MEGTGDGEEEEEEEEEEGGGGGGSLVHADRGARASVGFVCVCVD